MTTSSVDLFRIQLRCMMTLFIISGLDLKFGLLDCFCYDGVKLRFEVRFYSIHFAVNKFG